MSALKKKKRHKGKSEGYEEQTLFNVLFLAGRWRDYVRRYEWPSEMERERSSADSQPTTGFCQHPE